MIRNQNEPLVRAKRRPHNLPNAWDDDFIRETKTKKDHTKNKYKDGGRGQKHVIEVEDHLVSFRLAQYFAQHHIPHRVEKKYKSEIVTYIKKSVWGPVRKVPYYTRKPIYEGKKLIGYDGHQIGYRWIYGDIPCEPKKITKKISHLIGYKITWWSNKDIGIERLIQQFVR